MEWRQGGPAGIEECPEIVASGAKGPGRLGVRPVAGTVECLNGMSPDPRDDLGNSVGDGEMDVVS